MTESTKNAPASRMASVFECDGGRHRQRDDGRRRRAPGHQYARRTVRGGAEQPAPDQRGDPRSQDEPAKSRETARVARLGGRHEEWW
ncbi:MAG: hypothetical protein R2878_01630 [Thermoleophilia bacterium]